MKVGKTQAVLYIFEQLFLYKEIMRENIQYTISISNLTFRRYIQELRAFLANFHQGYEIVYSKETKKYYLKQSSGELD